MHYTKFIVTLALLISAANPALIYIPNIEIDPIYIYQVQVACDRLEANLRATYGMPNENTNKMYSQTYAANYFLQILSNLPEIARYTNIVVGDNNTANTNRSLIIGNNNLVLGTGNYVFSNNFNAANTTSQSNNLILD